MPKCGIQGQKAYCTAKDLLRHTTADSAAIAGRTPEQIDGRVGRGITRASGAQGANTYADSTSEVRG